MDSCAAQLLIIDLLLRAFLKLSKPPNQVISSFRPSVLPPRPVLSPFSFSKRRLEFLGERNRKKNGRDRKAQNLRLRSIDRGPFVIGPIDVNSEPEDVRGKSSDATRLIPSRLSPLRPRSSMPTSGSNGEPNVGHDSRTAVKGL